MAGPISRWLGATGALSIALSLWPQTVAAYRAPQRVVWATVLLQVVASSSMLAYVCLEIAPASGWPLVASNASALAASLATVAIKARPSPSVPSRPPDS